MKTQTKKILMGLGIALLGNFAAKAQGLQNIIVEKYYQVNAADITAAAAAATNGGNTLTLAPGSIVYRVFADMAPGYKLNAQYGNANHTLKFTSTTTFFNHPDGDNSIGNQLNPAGNSGLRKETRMIDSYLTVGQAGSGKVGIPKTLDGDGSIGNVSATVLANNPGGVFGLPITGAGAADGIVTGTNGVHYQNPLTTVGGISTPAGLVFDGAVTALSGPQGSFAVNAGAISGLGGSVGTTTDNIVLLGQFTTDGVFGFELNVSIQNTVTSIVENWVANNVQAGEFTMSALTLAPPTVTITSPSNGANIVTGTNMTITAGAAATGTVSSVEFFVNGTSIGVDNTSPFSALYTATAGSKTITALATDNTSLTALSAPVVINVANNIAPTATVLAPATLTAPAIATFTASAGDLDGTVASISYSIDNGALGTGSVSGSGPYTFTWTSVAGVHNVRVAATDNLGLVSTVVTPVNFTVTANQPPVVNITSPTSGTIISGSSGTVITSFVIDANASDIDGVITQVQAIVNNSVVATFTNAAANYTVSVVTNTAFAVTNVKVVATDDAANTTTAQVNINISNPNGDPYLIDRVAQACNEGTFSLAFKSSSSYTVDNVIGYDFVVSYNSASLTPTGGFTVNPASIANYIPSGVGATTVTADQYTNTPGTMTVSIYFQASPATTPPYFNATNPLGQDIFFLGFQKNVMTSNDSTDIQIVGGTIQESYYTAIANPVITKGKYVTFRETIFKSRLYNYINLSPLSNTLVPTEIYGTNGTLKSSFLSTVVATASVTGRFDYNVLNGDNVKIRRDVPSSTAVQFVVNGADATLGKLVLANSAAFLPSVSQMIALDVNMDGVVSSGDITQINQRAVNQIPEYKQAWNYNAAGTNTFAPTTSGLGLPAWVADSKDWQFIDSILVDPTAAASYTPYAGIYAKYKRSVNYPAPDVAGGFWKNNVPVVPFVWAVPQTSLVGGTNANCPTITDRGYLSVFVGDADGSYTTTTGSFAGRQASNSNKIVLDLANSIVKDNSIDVPVSFVSSSSVYAVDFALKYEENNMSFLQMVNYPNSTDVIAFKNPNDKVLRVTSSKAIAGGIYNADQPVASIRFDLKNGGISPEQFSSLEGYLNGQPVIVEVSSKSVGINSLGNNDAVSVYPNPTSGLLNITSANDATIQMFDISGRELLLESSVSASKTQQINVSGLLNGVYILKVTSNDYTTVKKVVLSK